MEEKIGAAWRRTYHDKKTNQERAYWSGQFEVGEQVIKFVAYPNSYKTEGDKKPDILFYRAKPISKSDEEDCPI